MKITASKLIRFDGLSAMLAGILFILIQMIHPTDILSSVTTSRTIWKWYSIEIHPSVTV
jgi:hypothetical protein